MGQHFQAVRLAQSRKRAPGLRARRISSASQKGRWPRRCRCQQPVPLLHRMAGSTGASRPDVPRPKWSATRRLQHLQSPRSSCSPPRGTRWLSHGMSSRDRRKSRAHSRRVPLRGNEGGIRRVHRAARPNGPFQDSASLHGKSRCQMSADPFGIPSSRNRTNRCLPRKDRVELCLGNRRSFRPD